MAIGYVGIPGSGKSHTLVESVIIPSLKEGKKVFTNIPLNTGNICRIHKITGEQINRLTVIPDETDETGKVQQPMMKLFVPSENPEQNVLIGSVVVQDEAQTSLPFDERRSNPDLKRLRDYVSHHRHYDVEWHWATQSEHLVDVTLRRLTDTVYLFKNLKHTTRGKMAKYGAYRQRLYMMTDGEVDKEMITEDIVDVKPQTFMCYKSFVGNEVAGKFKAPMPRFLRNGLIIAGILTGVVLPFTVYKTVSWYKQITRKPGETAQKRGAEQNEKSTGSNVAMVNISAKPKIEYDGYFSTYRNGQIAHLLLRNGQTVYECADPLFSFETPICGNDSLQRVARTSVPNGLGASGSSAGGLSGVATERGVGQ